MKKLIALTVVLLTTLTLFAQSTNKIKVGLAWDPNPEPNVSYIVHMGGVSGIYTNTTPSISTNCVITNLSENVKYYFVVTAVDTNSLLESDISNEVVVGSTLNFTNLVSLPPSSLTLTSAVLNLRVVGSTNPINAWFRYGTNENYLTTSVGQDDLMPTTNGVLNYSVTLTNLTAPTYYFRSFAFLWTNGIGVYSTPIARFDLIQKPAAPTSIQIFKVESVVK